MGHAYWRKRAAASDRETRGVAPLAATDGERCEGWDGSERCPERATKEVRTREPGGPWHLCARHADA